MSKMYGISIYDSRQVGTLMNRPPLYISGTLKQKLRINAKVNAVKRLGGKDMPFLVAEVRDLYILA